MKSTFNFRPFGQLLTAASLLSSLTTAAQSRPAPPPAQIERRADGTAELVRFEPTAAPAADQAPAALREALGLSARNELRPSEPAETDDLGYSHQKYQQYYQGVPVEFTAYTTHSRRGVVEFMTGETRAIADGALSVQPALTAAAALPAALAFVGATQYMWQLPEEGRLAQDAEGKSTYRPTGELVIVDNLLAADPARHGRPVLAWKFNIYAAQPVSRAWIYVDAQTGVVVNQDAIIKHATGSFATRYSGTRSVQTTLLPIINQYYLFDNTRGQGVQTQNLKRSNVIGNASLFLDANNVWTAAEFNNANFDNIAGDAHFGAEMTYDYWSVVHGRNSYNNAGAVLKSYVHYDDTPGDGKGLDNAFWDGAVMKYGDGDTKFRPLASLDVCGHEIGHAICQSTAGLQYQNESGAMNEGFSDIWGACVEQRAASLFGLAGKSTWLIGEEIRLSGGALRSMSNPNTYGQPDTYQGTNWYSGTNDHGGVHTNSGVLNFWFYLLSQGGTGTNDKGNAYSVSALGITKAAKIAYLAEKLLSPTSTYASARTMAIQAATTLYGAGSNEVRQVTNAMYAVGIGSGIAYGITTVRYIDAIGLNTLARFSGSDNGYFNGTAGLAVPVVTRCSQQNLLVSAGFTGAVANQYWNAYVDFNHDNDFNDAGERVINNRLVTTASWVTVPFIVPSGALLGAARMRVIMTSAATSLTNGYVGSGEVEDYTIAVGSAVAVPTPASLSAVAITASSATLQWANATGAASYNVQYRQNTSFIWTTVTSAGNSRPVAGLSAGKQYLFRVQAVNGCGTVGAYSATVSFSTPLFRAASPAPTTDSLTAGVTSARVTGLAGSAATLQAGAYPNPATDALHLTLSDAQQAEQAITTVEVRDARGAQVFSAPFDAATGTLRIEALTPGLYTATVRGSDQPATVRFVKQ